MSKSIKHWLETIDWVIVLVVAVIVIFVITLSFALIAN